jgi:hypothetical protein
MRPFDTSNPSLYEAYTIIELDESRFSYRSLKSGTLFLVTKVADDFEFSAGDSVSDRAPIRCEEPLPTFTLNKPSFSESEIAALCSCLWSQLDSDEKQVSRLVSGGQRSEVSDDDYAEFYASWFVFGLPSCIARLTQQ